MLQAEEMRDPRRPLGGELGGRELREHAVQGCASTRGERIEEPLCLWRRHGGLEFEKIPGDTFRTATSQKAK